MTREEYAASNREFMAMFGEQSLNGGPFNIGLRKAWANFYDEHPDAIDELMRIVNVR